LVDAKAGNGATPLIAAVHFKKTEILKLLLEKGATVNGGAGHAGTALWYASADGNLEAVKLLLDKGATVDAMDSDKTTPLLLAAENGQLEVVRLLLSKGAAVNSAADEASRHNGATPLIGATNGAQDYQAPIGGVRASSPNRKHGYLEVVSLLLEKGAAANKKDNFGATALIYASENGQVEVVSLLLAKGAMVDAKTNEGKPALYYASGNPDVTKVLLEKGANPAGAK
jgi:ankyrin repeat protein